MVAPKVWARELEGSSSSDDGEDEAVKEEQPQPREPEKPVDDDGEAPPPNANAKRAPSPRARADPAPAPAAKKPKATITFEDLEAAGFRGGPSVLRMREGAFDPNAGVGTAWSDGRAERAAREAAAAGAAGDKDSGGGGGRPALNDADAIREQIEEDARISRLTVKRSEQERAARGGRGQGRGRARGGSNHGGS